MSSSELFEYNERNDQYLVVHLIDGKPHQYVVCSHYNPDAKFGEQWDWGHYFNKLDNALMYLRREE